MKINWLAQKKNGFTLIELLVVIAIVGLLTSIVMVSLNSAREKAKIARAKLDVAAIKVGLTLYTEEHGGTFDSMPLFSCDAAPGGNNICDQATWNAGWFRPYVAYVPLDPWGSSYFFDGIPVLGYENDMSECGPWGTAVISFGPDKVLEGVNGPGPLGDDIAVYFDNPSRCN